MANNINLTAEEIKNLRYAFAHFFPEDAIYVSDGPFSSGNFEWRGRKDFIDFVYYLTGIKIQSERDFADIKKAQLEVENLLSSPEATESGTSTIPDEWRREQQEAERQKLEEETKKSEEKAEKQSARFEETLKKRSEEISQAEKQQKEWEDLQKENPLKTIPKKEQKSVTDELKDTVVYAVPDKKAESITLTKEEQDFIQIAKEDPETFEQKLSELIIEKNADIPKETLEPLSKALAADATLALADPNNKFVPTGVHAAMASVSEQLVGLKEDTKKELLKSVAVITPISETNENLYRTLLYRTIGENITNLVLGIPEATYHLSNTEVENSFKVDVSIYQQSSFALQENYSRIFNNPVLGQVKSLGTKELKKYALSKFDSIPKNPLFDTLARLKNVKTFDNLVPYIQGSTKFGYVANNFFTQTVTKLLPEYTPVISNITAKLGIDIGIKGIASELLKDVAKTGLKTAIKTAGKELAKQGAKIAAELAAGPETGGLSWALIAFNAIKSFGKNISNFFKEKLPEAVPVIFAVVGFVGGYLFGGVTAGIIGGTGGGAIGLSITKGVSATSTLGSVVSGATGAIATMGAALASAIGIPIVVTLLVFPVVVALILFIITAGAYVVPPSAIYTGTGVNPYIGVEKVANPPGPFQNSTSNITTYTVTITAKIEPLTNVQITDNCEVVNKDVSAACPAATIPTPPDVIDPSSPYTFTYDAAFDSNVYFDSLITNTITVTGVVSAGTQTASGGTAIIIGEPPTGCLTLDTSWDTYPTERGIILTAITQLAQAQYYMTELCAAGPIVITYDSNPSVTYGGEILNGGITIYQPGVHLGQTGALFTLTHESGHMYARRTDKYSLYESNTATAAERPICTYIVNPHPASEDFAEMIGLYVAKTSSARNAACLTSSFRDQYPSHWSFARDNIFHEDLGW